MRAPFVVMWLENNPYPADGRVRREASALVDAGWDVAVVCPRAPGQNSYDEIAGVTVHRYRRPEATSRAFDFVAEYLVAFVFTAVITAKLRFSRRIDVIHAHNPPDVFFPLAAVFRLLGAQFVFDHHDLAPEMYRARFADQARPAVQRVLEWCERRTIRLADHVIVTNESYREIAMGRGGKHPDRVTVVRNGPDLGSVRPRPPDPDIAGRADLVVGYVGELGHQDGVDHLIRAVGHLAGEHGIDVHAMVVGSGSARPQLEALTRELGLVDQITFTGWLETDDAMRVLSSTSLGIGPDPSNEYNDRSTMIKLTEYLALGLPVVAYDLPENRRTCEDAARYAGSSDPAQLAAEIAALWADDEARGRMSERGLQRAQAVLSWELQAPALLAVYETLGRRRR